MDLELISWAGHSINDKTNYSSYILPESKADLTVNPVTSNRNENYPHLSGAALPSHSFTFEITICSDDEKAQQGLRTQMLGWFSPLDFQLHNLIAEDRLDKNALGVARQYQFTGLVARVSADTGPGKGYVTFLVTIAVLEPIWQAVTATSDVWPITATAQTRSLSVLGNTFSRPKFTIQPTVARTGQFAYSRWLQFYNRVALPLTNRPIDVTNGGLSTTGLVNDTSKSNQINVGGGITAVATTIPIDTPVGGGLPSVGFGYVGTEQISWTANSGTSLTGVTRGIGGTTAAVHADNAVIAQSKMLANGADIRVQVDGALVNLWIDSPNTAATKIWIAQNWQPGQAGTLRTALPNNGTAVTVQFTSNSANKAVLTALKTARNNVFIIDSEAFTYSPANIDLVKYQITNCSRAQKNTSFAAHSVAAAITWIEHDIWVLYGNGSATAFDTDDNQKPLLNLNTSTNTSWVQTQFFDSTSPRPAAWQGAVLASAGKASSIYTADQKTSANPATELGMDMLNYQAANIWKSETAQLAWSFYDPCGITTVSMAGKKYLLTLVTPTWPPIAGLQKSNNGTSWSTVWTEAVPTLANTWQTWTHNAQSLVSTFTNIRVALIGTISAQPSNEAALQADTITLTLDSTKTPSVTLGAENSTYYLNLTLTNNTTGQYIILSLQMKLNQILTVDCAAKTVSLDDGSNQIAALTLSGVRNDWLDLQPGTNTLQVDDTGIANISLTTQWNDRDF